jgi:fumarylpyruvate hydrolase
MKKFCFAPAEIVSLPIHQTDSFFPVRRIFCVGLNYAKHTQEMGGNPDRDAPLLFSKPPQALLAAKTMADIIRLPYPTETNELHHEIELVVAIGKNVSSQMNMSDIEQSIFGYALGLDMTRRDKQLELKKQGRPWDIAKSFEDSTPISPIVLSPHFQALPQHTISLKRNQTLVQQATLAEMIWSCQELIHETSRFFTLQAGDLIFTGTPSGVGEVKKGDLLEGSIGDSLYLQAQVF